MAKNREETRAELEKDPSYMALSPGAREIALDLVVYPQPELTKEELDYGLKVVERLNKESERESNSLDMPALSDPETIEAGIEISQQLAKWMLENKRCAILDIETSQVYTVSLSPTVLDRLRAT